MFVCFPANHCPIATCEKSVPTVICKASVVPIVLSMDQKLSKELDLRNPPVQREQCYKVITNMQGPCGRMLMLPVWDSFDPDEAWSVTDEVTAAEGQSELREQLR